MNTVAVIGAGVTGLTAAYRLRQQGIPVTLYDASDRAGGVIRSVKEGGFLAEAGPNSILETSPTIKALVEDLGLEKRRLYPDDSAKKRFIVRGGRPVAMPGSFGGFLGTPLFSFPAKLRLLLEPFIRRSSPDCEESLADFVRRRIGREFLDYAINPFVAGVYAGDPKRLSVAHAFPKLLALEQKYGSLILGQILGARERKRRAEVSKQNARMFSFDDGLEVLTQALTERLADQLRLQTRVKELVAEPSTPGWTVVAERDGQRTSETHAAVLYAGTAHQLQAMNIRGPRPLGLEVLGDVFYPPVSSLVMGFRREDVRHPLDGFGMLIPQVEGFKILGTLFTSSLFSGRAPQGHVTLSSFVGGARAPELASLSRDELIKITLQDLRAILGVTGEPVFVHHAFYPRAIPQYEVGYGRYKTLMNDIESKAPGLFLAGHYRDGISMADSILSGDNVAGRIAAYLRPEPKPAILQSSTVQQSALT